ncbi:hypothetical protein HMPREF3038_03182 [Akkermansia sp. KLE1797]|nr:hypothetical protein HMPREF3038_03182 [Akkermansia sp. KLE1797]KZA03335.1 hypothetical protein HMPREF1326_03055 [Akkermansia sp. KLE1605]
MVLAGFFMPAEAALREQGGRNRSCCGNIAPSIALTVPRRRRKAAP